MQHRAGARVSEDALLQELRKEFRQQFGIAGEDERRSEMEEEAGPAANASRHVERSPRDPPSESGKCGHGGALRCSG